MREHESGVGCKCAEHLCCGSVVELVEAAAQRLAVKRDAAWVSLRECCLEFRGMAAKDRLDGGGIETLEDVTDRGVRGCAAPFQTKGRVQLAAMHLDEGDDATIGVAAGDDGQDGE